MKNKNKCSFIFLSPVTYDVSNCKFMPTFGPLILYTENLRNIIKLDIHKHWGCGSGNNIVILNRIMMTLVHIVVKLFECLY